MKNIIKKNKLAVTAKEKEDVRRKLVVTAKQLAVTAKQLAAIAREKESVRSKLAVTAKEKESIRRKLEITAETLRLKAKQLAVTAKQLAEIAREKESVRRKLAVTAKRLATIAKEKEIIKHKLAIVAKKLAVTAKEKESVRLRLVVTAKEKEDVRRKLVVTAKQLAVTAKQLAAIAREKESIRRKLAVTAGELALKAKQQNKIETKLKGSEIRYRRLFETAHDGILILDFQTGQITDVNPFLEKLLGYSRNEFLNKKLWQVGAFKNTKASRAAFKVLQKEGHLHYEDLPLETKSGQPVEVEFVSNSYMAGEILVIQCNIRDITERKKLELIKETDRLLEEERLKVSSIADATHELRTPLAIIKGNVDLAMQDQSKNPKSSRSAFRAINYEIKHLSGILSDLTLITSKKGELKNRIVFDKVNLRSLITVVVGRCKAIAYKKNISITARKIPSLIILGDKVHLEKMLANLIKNSILYGNKNGHTEILAKQSRGFITISIADDGIGISKEDLPHVFERFYRADKSHTSDANSIGIGLGLSIVKWVAEAHGGTVNAKNKKSKGSVFSVSLPIKASNPHS